MTADDSPRRTTTRAAKASPSDLYPATRCPDIGGSYHDRRLARRLDGPDFRAAYEDAADPRHGTPVWPDCICIGLCGIEAFGGNEPRRRCRKHDTPSKHGPRVKPEPLYRIVYKTMAGEGEWRSVFQHSWPVLLRTLRNWGPAGRSYVARVERVN